MKTSLGIIFFGISIFFPFMLSAQTQVPANSDSPIYYKSEFVGIGVKNPSRYFEVYSQPYGLFAPTFTMSSSDTNLMGVSTSLNLKNESLVNNNWSRLHFINGENETGASICVQFKDHDSENMTADLVFARKYQGGYFESFRVKGNGNFGIGTSNPQSKLDVNGSAQIRGTLFVDKPNHISSDWNEMWQSGFFDGEAKDNSPNGLGGWFWGINMGHTHNRSGYSYGGQVLIRNTSSGELYFRNRNVKGEGDWYKVLTNKGDQIINGSLETSEIKITSSPGADFVFEEDYNLRSLEEVSNFISINKHLPEIPSAEEMEKDGVDLAKLNIQLLQKIEELTLYTLEQEQKLKSQEQEIADIKSLLEQLVNQ